MINENNKKKNPIFSKSEYIVEEKISVDVKAKSFSKKQISFKIPAWDNFDKLGSVDQMHPTLQLLTKSFSVS